MAHGLNWRGLAQTVAGEAGRMNCAPLSKSKVAEICGYASFFMWRATGATLAQTGADWRTKDGCVSAPVYTPKGVLNWALTGAPQPSDAEWRK